MPYTVKYTDPTKPAIEVSDNTTNTTDTSISFSGRNTTNYGTVVAENFLHILENFAGPTEPNAAVEGQLWYNNTEEVLYVFDGGAWKTASGVKTGDSEPTTGKIGDIWVDTDNQQLYIYSGAVWILVGPLYSSGVKSGPLVEQIFDVDGVSHFVVTTYVSGTPLTIFSKDKFSPRAIIDGFQDGVEIGVNLSKALTAKLHGTATAADALNVRGNTINAANFLRGDEASTTNYQLNVLSDNGLVLGSDGNFKLNISASDAVLTNSASDGGISFRTSKNGIPTTSIKIQNQRVGINSENPQEDLDVAGNQRISGTLKLTGNTQTTNLTSGTLITSGGAAIAKNAIVGENLRVIGTTTAADILPDTSVRKIGAVGAPWSEVRAVNVYASGKFYGTLDGSFTGNADTATALKNTVTFKMTGDVTLQQDLEFKGNENIRTFNTVLSADIINNKTQISTSVASDQFLVYRAGLGLRKIPRDNMVGDLAVPIGGLIPFAGVNPPDGWLLCDGGEVEKDRYQELYLLIGDLYGTPTNSAFFKLPDLRGRFPMGSDSMNNATFPGGGTAGRVPGATLATSGGAIERQLTVSNLPDHEHDMKGNTNIQYYAVNPGEAAVPPVQDVGAINSSGGSSGTSQYNPSSGGIKAEILGQAFSLLNPYVAFNYLIRSGRPGY